MNGLVPHGKISEMNRRNLLTIEPERWKPPVISPTQTPGQRALHALRRFFDLQAGSGWKDLSPVLRSVDGTLLDVGCGSQPYRCLVSPNAVYRAIDTADAEAHFGYKMPDTTYYDGDIWPVVDSSVDFVLCTETLEHIPKPATFLAEASRVLRPGGKLILTVPFSARWHFIPYDYWRYTPSGLKILFEDAGFEKVEVYARGNEWTVAAYKTMALLLPLLFAPIRPNITRFLELVIGVVFIPAITVLAIIGNLSLALTKGGDDCLGYTAFAVRKY